MKTKKTFFCLVVFLCICFGSYEVKSQQNGEWNIISEVPGGRNKIYFIDSKHGWVIGSGGEIYVTDDGGITWLPQNSGIKNKLESIHFIDDTTGFVCGYQKKLLYTNNKGNTWTPIDVVSDSGSIYSSLCSDTNNNLYFITNYGEVFCSEDSGATWYNKYNFNDWGFSYLNYSNNPVCFAMQFMQGTLYKSNDGGEVWEEFSMPSPWYGDIYFLNGDIGWITEDWNSSSGLDTLSIYITTDGSETWIRQSSFQEFSLYNIIFLDMVEGWASTVSKIYYTTDSGQSWICQYTADNIGFIIDIFFLDDRNGWALTNQGTIIKYSIPTGVSAEKYDNIYPNEYILYQNYPNPFNPSAKIKYSIPEIGFVILKVFNMLGQEVAVLVDQHKNAGEYVVDFDASNLAGGIYIYSIQAGKYSSTKKMILLR